MTTAELELIEFAVTWICVTVAFRSFCAVMVAAVVHR